MSLQRLLLTACAATFMAVPVAVLADPPQGHGAPSGQHGASGPPSGQTSTHHGGPMSGPVNGGFRPGPGPAPPPHPSGPAPSQPGQGPRPGYHSASHWAPPPVAHPPPLADWNRNLRGPDRWRYTQEWRAQHHDWDRYAPWRHNRDWWRRYPGFRWYTGFRVGFFFFPEVGYVAAPPDYVNQYWSIGSYLPAWFWQYAIQDYGAYGLPAPPDGCGWIWLNGDIALVDLSDGYIVDIIRDAW
jgi:Ni/Co efflux regulator RcnB